VGVEEKLHGTSTTLHLQKLALEVSSMEKGKSVRLDIIVVGYSEQPNHQERLLKRKGMCFALTKKVHFT